MTEDEIKELIKKEIINNICITVDITGSSYTNDDYYKINVKVEYDGIELNSFGDMLYLPNNQ